VRARRALALLGALTVVAGCSLVGGGPPGAPGELGEVPLVLSAPPGGVSGSDSAREVRVTDDGTWVVRTEGFNSSGIVRVRDGEVLSRSVLRGRALAAVPRADGSITVVATGTGDTVLRVGVVPPGGAPGPIDPVTTRPLDPPLFLEDEYAGVDAVLAADGADLVVVVDPLDAPPAILRIDPATGAVGEPMTLPSRPSGLFVTADGSELVLVLGQDDARTHVVRLPADLSAPPGPPVVLDGVTQMSTLGPDDTLYVLLEDGDGPALHALAPGASELVRLVALPDAADYLANGGYNALAVDRASGRAFVVGSGGEDSDVAEPFLMVADLETGKVDEPLFLARAGWIASAAVTGEQLLIVGSGADEDLSYVPIVWTYGLG
jgi:hypothetical protein